MGELNKECVLLSTLMARCLGIFRLFLSAVPHPRLTFAQTGRHASTVPIAIFYSLLICPHFMGQDSELLPVQPAQSSRSFCLVYSQTLYPRWATTQYAPL